jgi:hypothetical protein
MSLVVYINVMRLVEMHEGWAKYPEEEKMTAGVAVLAADVLQLLFQRDVWTEAPTAFAGHTPAEYLESLLRAFRRASQREGQAHALLSMKEIGN